MENVQDFGASWIWFDRENLVNQYAEFRHEFNLESLQDHEYKLYISADTDYVVWLNGSFVACGQYTDYPYDKVYDVLDVKSFIRSGKNALCIMVYYQGESTSTYMKGQPGLWFVLDAGDSTILSDERVYCRKSSSYKNGPVPKITVQLSFTYQYDAQREDDWTEPDYKMGHEWKPSCIIDRSFDNKQLTYSKRPIRKLVIKDRVDCSIIAQGKFIRLGDDNRTVAELIQSDYLSPLLMEDIFHEGFDGHLPCQDGGRFKMNNMKPNEGIYLVIDAGREEAGLFDIELSANPGTIVDIGYGQHIDDLRVRAAVGGRNFANRYISKGGRQRFTHYTTRLGGRYIELHISNVQDEFVLYYAGIRPTEYPVEIKGQFVSPNSLWNQIYDVGIRTLHLCMHEHYEDTPWREQALYSMDSRNQALCGYYCFGEYDFPEASFDLLGKGLKEDGYLELCAPAEVPITIPCFSMAWIMELADHLLYSGRTNLARTSMSKVKFMLDTYMANMEEGLLVSPQGNRYWHFYEWADGLDHPEIFRGKGLKTKRFDAPLNAFFAMALVAGAKLAEACQQHELADRYLSCANEVKKAINEVFWNENEQVFTTYIGEGCEAHYAELTQALIICAGACSQERVALLKARLAEDENGLVKTTLSHSLYKYQALLHGSDEYAKIVFDRIEKDWGYMLYKGATSFWETIEGSNDFSKGGSLCHGWSAIPVYFYQAYILGIKPLEPGFRTFEADPMFSVLDKVYGKVPTPYGDITVKWEKVGDKIECSIDHPEGTKRINNQDIKI